MTVTEVGETTARVSYSASFSLPDSTYSTSYSGSIGGTSISSRSGVVKVTGLTKGVKNSISGSITCYYQYTTTSTSTSTDSEGNTTTTVTTNYHSDSKSINLGTCYAYTHPGSWSWSKYIAKNDIIQETLKAADINKWVTHLAAWKSWDVQSDHYDDYDTYFNVDRYLNDDRNNGGYKVNSGDIICLGWYNNCANAHPRASQISHNNNEDIISVDIFSKLDFNGCGEV